MKHIAWNMFHKYIACSIFAAQCTLRKYISHNLLQFLNLNGWKMRQQRLKLRSISSNNTINEVFLIYFRRSVHLRNKLLEICCMKDKSFVWCNKSMNFNGTAHTMKEETYRLCHEKTYVSNFALSFYCMNGSIEGGCTNYKNSSSDFIARSVLLEFFKVMCLPSIDPFMQLSEKRIIWHIGGFFVTTTICSLKYISWNSSIMLREKMLRNLRYVVHVFHRFKQNDYNKLYEIYFLNVHEAANILHTIYLWNMFRKCTLRLMKLMPLVS